MEPIPEDSASPPSRVGTSSTITPHVQLPPTTAAYLPRSDTDHDLPPGVSRRATRSLTFRTIEEWEGDEERPEGWEPGGEPGRNRTSGPLYECDIKVVDFAQDHMDLRRFDNEGLIEFLKLPQDKEAKCRWININGFSPDVIEAVGKYKGLHVLALEDLMENKRSMPKAEWYPNHAFIMLTLQKVVTTEEDDDDGSSLATAKSTIGFLRRLKNLWCGRSGSHHRDGHDPEKRRHGAHHDGSTAESSPRPGYEPLPPMKTLQRYHGTPNSDRTRFMEQNSALKDVEHQGHKGLVVMAEQVGIFLTSDNTVISFFETSAEDIEKPIIRRLGERGTILRESYDGSLLVQAIIDAIVDLALPLTEKYSIAIENIEIDVLTKPDIEQSIKLYIVISEINKMLSFLNPIDNVVNVFRDHKTDMSQAEALRELQNPASGVIVTPMTHTYLGDVLDHCVMVTEALVQIKNSADNLINLIFNTISANQNESMKALTVVTIIFLPLTFITGFFGQNFVRFPELDRGIEYFWQVATPTAVATAVVVMWGTFSTYLKYRVRRFHFANIRRMNFLEDKERKEKKREKLMAAAGRR